MVHRVISYFLKTDGHSATVTDLKNNMNIAKVKKNTTQRKPTIFEPFKMSTLSLYRVSQKNETHFQFLITLKLFNPFTCLYTS